MRSITAHVLDSTGGTPAEGIEIRLFANEWMVIASAVTNSDGRVPDLGHDSLQVTTAESSARAFISRTETRQLSIPGYRSISRSSAGSRPTRDTPRHEIEDLNATSQLRDGDQDSVISGFYDLTVLKSTESGFEGYPKDQYTTLQETNDRILATDISTRWRYNTTDVDFNAVYESVKAIILDTFTQGYSAALQQTLFQMGEAVIEVVIEAHPEIDEIKFSCLNKHHFVYDLSFCGLEAPNEVFYAADRPYGLGEATIERAGAPRAGEEWVGIVGFCQASSHGKGKSRRRRSP